jgi:hypothetical protein
MFSFFYHNTIMGKTKVFFLFSLQFRQWGEVEYQEAIEEEGARRTVEKEIEAARDRGLFAIRP